MEIELKFKEGFIRYKKDLEDQLNKAKTERQELIEKFTNGELLTADDAIRNKKLADAIKSIERALDKVAEVEYYDHVEKVIIALSNPTLTAKQKEAGKNFVIKSLLSFNRVAISNLSAITNFPKDELQNVNHTIILVRKEITDLDYEINILKKYGHSTDELEGKRQLAKEKLNILNQFKGILFDEDSLEENLRNLSSNKTPDGIKDATITRYRKMIKRHKDLKIDSLVLDIKNHPIEDINEKTIPNNEPQIEEKADEKAMTQPISIVAPIPEITPQQSTLNEYEGPRLIDKDIDDQAELTTEGQTPEELDNAMENTPSIAQVEQNTNYFINNPFSSLDDEEEQDNEYTFINSNEPFEFPAEEEMESPSIAPTPINNSQENIEDKEIIEETPEIEESSLDETPDAEYEQLEDDFELEDNSFKGKVNRKFNAFKDWLYGGSYNYEDYELDGIVEDEYENPNSFKNKTKEKLAKVGRWLKKSWKPIAGITGATILVYALCTTFKGCKNDENLTHNPEENTYDPTIETTLEATYANAMINKLIDKGYTEYSAILMSDNYNKELLDTILSSPYNAAVENYATVRDFNYNYLNDYEEAKTIYGITSDKAVDYVNRSYKIMETGFYTDLTINEIVGVVKEIDNKTIFIDETNGFNHSINAALTNIYNDYAFGNSSIDSSVQKIEALKHFAPDGSDLDSFLTKFVDINKNVLRSRGNASLSDDSKKDMFNYLNVFANTFAGNTEGFNNPDQNAILEDTYDWNTAYVTFIKPLMSMYITESNAEDFACLQINMLSNYEQWIQLNGYCNEETVALG